MSRTLALALLVVVAAASARVARADDDPPKPAVDDTAKPAETPAAPDKPADKPADVATDKPENAITATPPKQVTVVVANGLLQRKGISPELTITGGVKLWKSDNAATRWWMGRVRAGVLFYNEPSFLAVGIAGQFGALDSRALGLEVQVMDLWSGFWGQGGVYPIDSTHGTTLEATIGYGLFGLEYQRRVSGAREGDQTLCLFLNVPLGMLRVVLKDPTGLMRSPVTAPVTER
jgi:hypothetical protein